MTIQERLKCVTPALATPLKKDGTFDAALYIRYYHGGFVR